MRLRLYGVLFLFIAALLNTGCSVSSCDYYSDDSRVVYSKITLPGKNELVVDVRKYRLEVNIKNGSVNKIIKTSIFHGDNDLNNLLRYVVFNDLLLADSSASTESGSENNLESVFIAYEGNTRLWKFSQNNPPVFLRNIKTLIAELLNHYYQGWENEIGSL
ncbi:MAG: hypothetical protein ACOYN6_00650 [Ignavibacteria bacterium]